MNKSTTEDLQNELTIFVNSCDKYQDCWDPFFSLLNKYWVNCKLPIVLNTESNGYYDKNLNILCPKVEKETNKHYKWGERFIEALKLVKTKYVLLILDDYFIYKPVDIPTLKIIIEIMNEEAVACTYLNNRGNAIKHFTKYNLLDEIDLIEKNRFNLQVAIWNKEKLFRYLRKHEDPWSLELFGSKRALKISDKIYCFNDQWFTGHGPIIKYPPPGGIARGKWVKWVIEEIIIPNGIEVKAEIRGYWNGQFESKNLLIRLKNKIKRAPSSAKSYFDYYLMSLAFFLKG